MVKAIFFDLWGTLVESGVHPSVIQQTRSILGLERMNFSAFVLQLERVLMTKAYDDKKQAFIDLCKSFRVKYNDRLIEELIGLWNSNVLMSTIYDDTIEELSKLKKKYKLVLITNLPSFSVQVLDKFNLHQYFDLELFSFKEGYLKTNPEFFELGLGRLKISKDEAVMVGDSIQTDIMGARNAGIKSILIDRKDKRDFSPKILSLRDLDKLLS